MSRRTEALAVTGADIYVEVLDPTWGDIPNEIKGTHLEGAKGYIVQQGDRQMMRESRVVATRDQAIELVLLTCRGAAGQSLMTAFGCCTTPADAQDITKRIKHALGAKDEDDLATFLSKMGRPVGRA